MIRASDQVGEEATSILTTITKVNAVIEAWAPSPARAMAADPSTLA